MNLFGLGKQKPHHYREMLGIAWENRDELPFAWRILKDGVCDGCALGTSGLSDWTLPGTHLCMVRLELLRLNTAPALDLEVLSDVPSLSTRTSSRTTPPPNASGGYIGTLVVSGTADCADGCPTSCGRSPSVGVSNAGAR